MNVLAIAAHPDDEVLGCGGTLAKLAREGHEIAVAILAEGITSRYADRQHADRALTGPPPACTSGGAIDRRKTGFPEEPAG